MKSILKTKTSKDAKLLHLVKKTLAETMTIENPKSSITQLSDDNPIWVGIRSNGVSINTIPAIWENPQNEKLVNCINDLKVKFSENKAVIFFVPEKLLEIFKQNFQGNLVYPRTTNIKILPKKKKK